MSIPIIHPLGYLSKVLRNYTEQACDGDFLSVRCPARTTITVQSAFYGRRGPSHPQQCPQTYRSLLGTYPVQKDDRYCSVSTALQVNTHSIHVYFILYYRPFRPFRPFNEIVVNRWIAQSINTGIQGITHFICHLLRCVSDFDAATTCSSLMF